MVGTITPPSPSVTMSEPEAEQRLLDAVIDLMEDEYTVKRFFIGVEFAHEWLAENGCDLDEHGFLVDADTREHKVPYTYKDSMLSMDDGPSGFMPVKEVREYKDDQYGDRIHLSNVYAFTEGDDGEMHPVKDSLIQMDLFKGETGTDFVTVAGWSTNAQGTLRRLHENDESNEETNSDIDEVIVKLAHPMDGEVISLSCLNPDCEHEALATEWNVDTDTMEPCCPNCSFAWSESVTFCMGCGEYHSGMVFPADLDDEYEGSMYDTPVCPNESCDAPDPKLEQYSRNDGNYVSENPDALDEYADEVEQDAEMYAPYDESMGRI